MQNISKFILVVVLAFSISACNNNEPEHKHNAINEEIEQEKAQEEQWHHCTADVDCVIVKTNSCVYAVDARSEKDAAEYYANEPCVNPPAKPEAVCKNNYCEVVGR